MFRNYGWEGLVGLLIVAIIIIVLIKVLVGVA